LAAVSGDLPISEKLTFGLTYIWILQWTNKFSDTAISNVSTGVVNPARIADPSTFRFLPLFLTNLDYDIVPEFTLGLGYYNLANQVGLDGKHRDPLWSPDARFFFDITANLDEIYTTLSGNRNKQDPAQASNPKQTASANHAAAQQARFSTLQNLSRF
jgi:hypothetical protein